MEKLTKERIRLIGSAESLPVLIEMIGQRMYWKIDKVEQSANYQLGRKQCYDIYTQNGLNKNVVIIKEGGRCRLYMIIQKNASK